MNYCEFTLKSTLVKLSHILHVPDCPKATNLFCYLPLLFLVHCCIYLARFLFRIVLHISYRGLLYVIFSQFCSMLKATGTVWFVIANICSLETSLLLLIDVSLAIVPHHLDTNIWIKIFIIDVRNYRLYHTWMSPPVLF